VLIRNLPHDISTKELTTLFGRVGPLPGTIAIGELQNAFGYAELDSNAGAINAVEKLHRKNIAGHPVNVSLVPSNPNNPSTTIFLGNLQSSITEQQIRSLVEGNNLGKVKRVEIRGVRTATADFPLLQTAEHTASHLDKQLLRGKTIAVEAKLAQTNDDTNNNDTTHDNSINNNSMRKSSNGSKKGDNTTKKLEEMLAASENLENLPSVPNSMVRRKARHAAKPDTAGSNWYNLPATRLTPELKADLAALQMRHIDSPKKFSKSGNKKLVTPKYFQIGTVVSGPTDFYSGRLTNKERKSSLAEEILGNQEVQKYAKRKFMEIQQKRAAVVRIGGRKNQQPKKQKN